MARNRYDVDEVLETGFNVKQLKRLVRYIKPHTGKMAAVIFMMMSASASTMIIPMFLKQIMDVYIPDKNMNGVILVSVLTLVIAVYSSTCTRLKVRTMSVIGQSIIHTIPPTSSATCRNCRSPTTTTGPTARSRSAWSTTSTA